MKTTRTASTTCTRPKYLLCALLTPSLLAPAAGAIFFASTPRAVLAAEGAASSLLGVAMPRGGAAYDEVDANFNDLLSKLAKEKVVAQTPAGDEPEVFIWKGAAYRADRVAFTKSGLQRALEGAGWTFKEVDQNQLRDVNIFASFDDSNGNELPFAHSVTKRALYFQASSAKAGKAVLGAWLESDDALALGLLPVEFVAPKAKAALPAVAAGAFLVKDKNDFSKGLPAPKTPAFPKMAPKPGTVRGVALDGSGKPLANVEVAVHSSIGGGVRTTHKARTNAQGVYQVLVPAGIAEVVQADYKTTYNGDKHTLNLRPADGDWTQFNAAKGHVEHLILRTSGESGGTVLLRDNVEGMVEVTLKPVGKLLDGSSGRTFVVRFDSTGESDAYLNGIPLGRYQLSARLLEDGEDLPLRAAFFFGSDDEREPKSSVTFGFKPGYELQQYNPGKSSSNVVPTRIMLQP
jgi:hypothetical protein